MKQTAVKKLKSTRGSGIAEALVGFLISVLSVITLLSVATTTLELIKKGDESIQVLYDEEGAMDQFINGGEADVAYGTPYMIYGTNGKYMIVATGVIDKGPYDPNNVMTVSTPVAQTARVEYYVTNHHRLFGFVPYMPD